MAKSFEQKDMTGALFKNDKHVEGDRLPVLTGNATIDGVEYRVAAWKNEPKTAGGKAYFSLAFQIPEARPSAKKPAAKPSKQREDDGFML